MDRRSFIKRTGVASLGIGLNYHKTFSKTKNGITSPVVIATWDVKKATQKAWEILLKNGANPNLVDGRGWIPLHQAVDQGHVGVVDMLIQAGSNVNAEMGGSGYTALDRGDMRQWPNVSDLIRKKGGFKSAQ